MKKNAATRIVFIILDADGDPVSGAAGLDSEYSLDGGAFNDCTNEATEIGASGIYYLDLLAGETNGDVVCIQCKTTTAGAKTTVLVFYTAAQSLNTIDTVVDAIKAKTDNLPADPASGAAVNAHTTAEVDDLITRVKGLNEIYDSVALRALEATLTAIKGVGWTTETLVAIKAAIDAIPTTAERGTDNALLAADYIAPNNAGIVTLLTRVTAAVALASVCTEARLAELDPGNIPADIHTLLTRLSALRAGYLDELDFNLQGALTTIHADLDNPDQYKADVSALALEATLTAIKGAGWTNETLKLIKELVDELESGEKPKPKAHFRI